MKLLLNLSLCWLGAFALMLVTLGVLGSFYEKRELLEITGGSGLTTYLTWVAVLSVAVLFRYFYRVIKS